MSVCFLAVLAAALMGDPEMITIDLKKTGALKKIPIQETLRLGPENGDDFLWGGAFVAVEADQAGRIYVLDEQENRIMVYAEDGRFLKQIGRQGKGPGEFEYLRAIGIGSDDRIYAFQNLQGTASYQIFDSEHQFLKQIDLTGKPYLYTSAQFSPDGKLMGSRIIDFNLSPGTMNVIDAVIDEKGEPVHEILKFQRDKFERTQVESSLYWTNYLAATFAETLRGKAAYSAFDHQGGFWTAVVDKYLLKHYNKQKNQDLEIQVLYRPEPYPAEELEAFVAPVRENIRAQLPQQLRHIISDQVVGAALEKAGIPPIKLPIAGISTDDKDHLIVKRPGDAVAGGAAADIYSGDGKYLGSIEIPNFGLAGGVFKNGNIYCMERNQDDENILVRYQIDL